MKRQWEARRNRLYADCKGKDARRARRPRRAGHDPSARGERAFRGPVGADGAAGPTQEVTRRARTWSLTARRPEGVKKASAPFGPYPKGAAHATRSHDPPPDGFFRALELRPGA